MMDIPKSRGIYLIMNIVTGVAYVGSSVNMRKRTSEHRRKLNKGIHTNTHIQSSWDKHGESSFEFSVIVEVLLSEHLIECEQYWIDTYSMQGSVYNKAPAAGSNVGVKASEETKKKIGDAKRGKKQSAEHIAKRVAQTVGKTRSESANKKTSMALLGRVYSEETKAKMSAAGASKIFTDEHRARISAAGKGRVDSESTLEKKRARRHSDETKEKMSSARLGKKASDDTRAKMSAVAKMRKRSAETKAKTSIASKLAWQKRREAKALAILAIDAAKQATIELEEVTT
jgi:group I intron endonuclease